MPEKAPLPMEVLLKPPRCPGCDSKLEAVRCVKLKTRREVQVVMRCPLHKSRFRFVFKDSAGKMH